MGFLRKVGRKIKKGVKKLFSSPLGGILGSMAINFMFPGIGQTFNNLFEGAKGALGFGTKEVAKEAGKEVLKEVGKEAVKEVGKEAVKEVGKEAVAKEITANVITDTATTSGATLTETLKKNFIDKPIQAGKDFINAPIQTTKELISPDGEFVGDVAQSLTTSALLGSFQGEPDEPFYSKGVSQQLSSVPSQEQVLSTVNSQVPQLNIKSFDEMSKSLYYGVLSPQWLANYNINK
jgi:hypothetical protein